MSKEFPSGSRETTPCSLLCTWRKPFWSRPTTSASSPSSLQRRTRVPLRSKQTATDQDIIIIRYICVESYSGVIPVEPSLVVGGQDGVRASLLKAADQRLEAADSPSDELSAAERLQAAVILHVVPMDQIVDAHCRVCVGHAEATACRDTSRRMLLPLMTGQLLLMAPETTSDSSDLFKLI